MGNIQCDARDAQLTRRLVRRSESSLSSDGVFCLKENIELEDFRTTQVRKVFQDACIKHSLSKAEVPFRVLREEILESQDSKSIFGSDVLQQLSSFQPEDPEETLNFFEFTYFLKQLSISPCLKEAKQGTFI